MAFKSVLFVDDEENILKGLKRMLHRYKKEWDMYFAVGAQEALEFLENVQVEVLVTDMKMPGMNGVELMQEVKKLYPKMARIVLSGHSERNDVIKSASLAHQYLAKPCKSDKLIGVINNTYYLNSILKDGEVRRVISTIEALPALPHTYNRLMSELNSPDFSLKKVGEIVAEDVGMSTSILKQVNSSFWGLANHIGSPEQAVNMLGAEIVKALVLSSHIFQLLDNNDAISIDDIEKTSLLTSRFSKVLASLLPMDRVQKDNAFIASLLLDVGRLILINNFPQTYQVVLEEVQRNQGYSLRQAEYTVMGVTHAEIGAYLLGLWGMPADIVSAVALHHVPKILDDGNDFVIAVAYAACAFATYFESSDEFSFESFEIDLEYCKSAGIEEVIKPAFNECVSIYRELENGK